MDHNVRRRYRWPVVGTVAYVLVSAAAWAVFLTRFHGLGPYSKSEEELSNNSLGLLFVFLFLFPLGLGTVGTSWLTVRLRPGLRTVLTAALILLALAIGGLLLYLASSTSNATY